MGQSCDEGSDTCFTGKGNNGQFRVVLPQPVKGNQIAVDMHVDTARPFTVTPFVVTPKAQTTLNQSSVTVPAGTHRLVTAFGNAPASVVGFVGFDADADFCVLGLQVAGVGVASLAQNGQCAGKAMEVLPGAD